MPKKQATKNKPEITFEVRFVGEGIEPDMIPLRAVHDALSAIQDIASGRDPYEMASAPPEKSIGLVDVKKGSAVYCCHAKEPREALANLRRVGKLLSADDSKAEWDELTASIAAIKSICEVAKSIGCRLEVRTPTAKTKAILRIVDTDYDRIKRRVFISGETMIAGKVERIGGATELRCSLRVPGRHKLLYCTVADENTAKQLGEHLYEDIVAAGTATWLQKTWRIHAFKIRNFSQPELGDPDEAIADLRAAGLDAWDNVKHPEKLIEDMKW